MLKNFRSLFFFLILFSLSVGSTFASHLRAGEITAKRTGPLTYDFTLTLYINTQGLTDQPEATLDFGDGTSQNQPFDSSTPIGPISIKTKKNVYTYTHTYSGPGDYVVSFFAENRNGGVVNMFDSYNTPFYIETLIRINPKWLFDSPPELTVPPIDIAAQCQKFFHNPGALDPDGDSLSYRLIIPRQAKNTNVVDYTYPDNSTHYLGNCLPAAPTFTIDPVTGNIEWDVPDRLGEYNIGKQCRMKKS